MLVYADDFVWDFEKPEIVDIFSNVGANKKIMMLNYRLGKVGKLEWTKGWDKYMFLNSTQEKELLQILPGVKTKVLPPCTELEEFFKVMPNYNTNLRIVRHNSQGDIKFSPTVKDEIERALKSRNDVYISMLPGPSFVEESDRFKKYRRTSISKEIANFLGIGNLFWYSLPEGYMDMGPRVILEAMAAGLPILADAWGGAIDRVTSDCGWLCSSKIEHLAVIRNITADDLKRRGEAARQRAKDEFIPEAWIKEIIGR
jgi:glycosyltransferase involved in cell wall biosynthesis